jgi:hypothetical protein
MCFRHTWDSIEGDMDLELLKSIREQVKEFPELKEVFFWRDWRTDGISPL